MFFYYPAIWYLFFVNINNIISFHHNILFHIRHHSHQNWRQFLRRCPCSILLSKVQLHQPKLKRFQSQYPFFPKFHQLLHLSFLQFCLQKHLRNQRRRRKKFFLHLSLSPWWNLFLPSIRFQYLHSSLAFLHHQHR